MLTIILGLGNPSLGDDAIGWRVVDALEARLAEEVKSQVVIERLSVGGISLMEHLAGFERALLVDSIDIPGGKPGDLLRLTLDTLPGTHANSIHDVSLKDALALGQRLGIELPDELIIYAVQIERKLEFSEELSAEVANSIDPAVEAMLAELQKWLIA